MASPRAIAAALKAVPGGARPTSAPQSTGWGPISPVAAQMLQNTNSNANTYGPFLPRPSHQFTDGAFGPMSPINPVPVDESPPGALFPDPRLWQYRVGWNLPTPPGTEGLKLASFDQLYTLSRKYSVARQCIELRIDEIQGLTWDIGLTTEAAKAYQGDRAMMRDFGERQLKARKFFKRPDPDYFSFQDFMQAMLEEIFVYDALSLVLRPKYGAGLGRGLLGSDLDHIKLVSGPTIRPLLDMMGGKPRPPAPAYQQYLYGVPRSDYQTIIAGTDIEDYGLTGAEINMFRSDVMLYRPYWTIRESPYGFPPVERALLPIISGLQKQEYQLDYFTEGTVPAVYISPGDPNITPTQIRELQDALNAIAGDPAYHMKVVVLPPGSKVEPQRPIDLSDSFDQLVQTQVCMAFDVQPVELGLLPNIGGANQGGPSASAIRFAGQEARDLKSRKSTKPLLTYICDIFNYIIQDVCNQPDMQFQFEGLVDDEDKQEITELGVQQVQNGIASIDEVRDRLDMPPWGLEETSEPVVFTAQGPIPFSMAPQLIAAMQQGMSGNNNSSSSNSSSKKKTSSSSSSGGSSGGKAQGTNGGQKTGASRSRTSQPSVRRGGQTKPNGSHPAPLSPHREAVTPGHAAAAGAVQGPGPRTGGTPNRSSVAGSRKKAVEAELDALRRHLRKGRLITTWDPRHINDRVLGKIAENMAKGVLIDKAIERAEDEMAAMDLDYAGWEIVDETDEPEAPESTIKAETQEWPGWEHDLGLIGYAKERIGDAFSQAESRAQGIRKDAVTTYSVSVSVLRGLINDEVKTVFSEALGPLWETAWMLGYHSAAQLTGKRETANAVPADVEGFIATQGEHWASEIARTGLGNNSARTENIARTEVARAINAGAMKCYRDAGVAYKHLLVSPDDTCDICKRAAKDGLIPLDQSYSVKGGEPPFHPQCRCVSAPPHVEAVPPESHLKKDDSAVEDPARCAFILLRARDPQDGKWRYLLQQRDDGTWNAPGGSAHMGEGPFENAMRETVEEIGPIPPVSPRVTLVQNRPDKLVHIFLCETSHFTPDLSNLKTPEETADVRWFPRKEIALLPLHKPFQKQWENIDWKQVAKQLAVNENGEVMIRDGGPGKPHASGSNWPYPHRVDGSQETGDSGGLWPDSGPGNAPQSEPGSLHDSSAHVDDWADAINSLSPPPGNSDGEMPDARGPAAERSRPTESGGAPSKPGNPGKQPDGSSVGATTGRPPGPTGKGRFSGMGGSHPAPARGDMNPAAGQSLSGGPVPAMTPEPYAPHAYIPVQNAPDGNECSVCNEPGDSPMHEIRPAKYPTVGMDPH